MKKYPANLLYAAIREGALWPILGYIVSVIGQFGLYKAIAIFCGVEAFGRFSIILAVVGAVNILFFGPFTQWAIRDYQDVKKTGKIAELFHLIYKYVAVAALLIAGITLLIVLAERHLAGLSHNIAISSSQLVIGVVLGVTTSACNLIYSLINSAKFPVVSAVLMAIDSLGRAVVVVVLGILGVASLNAIVECLIASQLLLLFLSFRFLIATQKRDSGWVASADGKLDLRQLYLNMFGYSWPFLVWGVSGYLASMADKWVLAANVGMADVGMYSSMIFLTMGVSNAITAAITNGFLPIIFRISGSSELDGNKKASLLVKELILGLSVMFAGLVALAYFFPEPIIAFFSSGKFTVYSGLLWILMIAAAAFNISQVLITRGLIYRKPVIYLPSKLLHGCIILASLLVLIPRLGIAGAAYALLIGNLLQLTLVLRVNLNALKA